jgi:hypothetical protein
MSFPFASASSVSSTVIRTVVSTEARAPPAEIATHGAGHRDVVRRLEDRIAVVFAEAIPKAA